MHVALVGALAGLLHVVSGPDHLVAVAPLAMKRPWTGLRIGVSWGLGHASGVLFVGAAGVVLRAFVDVEALSRWAEFVIGFVLIGVGIWAISQMRHVVLHKHPHRHEIDDDSSGADEARHVITDDVSTRADEARHAITDDVSTRADEARHAITDDVSTRAGEARHVNNPVYASQTDSHFVAPHESHLHVSSPVTRQINIHAHLHVHAKGACSDAKRMQKDPGRGSFFVGLIHGAAGTGHLLGVVPTLSLPPVLGAMYLGAYGVAAVVAMGAFGLTMGTIGNRLAPALLRRFMLGCGIVAIGLGLYWLQSGWRDIHGHHRVNNSRTVQDVG